jgi:hypothetical protein
VGFAVHAILELPWRALPGTSKFGLPVRIDAIVAVVIMTLSVRSCKLKAPNGLYNWRSGTDTFLALTGAMKMFWAGT